MSAQWREVGSLVLKHHTEVVRHPCQQDLFTKLSRRPLFPVSRFATSYRRKDGVHRGTQEEALCSHFGDTHPHTSSGRFPT